MARSLRILVVLALMLAPVVRAADDTSGSMVASGAWAVDGGSQSTMRPLGVYGAEADALLDFRLDAPSLRVTELRSTATNGRVINLVTPVEERSYSLTNASIRLAATPEGGWFGVYARPGILLEVAANQLTGEATSGAAYGNGAGTPEASPTGAVRAYSLNALYPHVALSAAGRATLEGPMTVKLQGPDLLIDAHENSTRVDTGYESVDPASALIEDRWLLLEADHAVLVLESAAPLVIPAVEADIAWQGELAAAAARGALATRDATYSAAGGPTRVDGAFQGRFHAVETKGVAQTRITLSGELERTSMDVVAAGAGAPLSTPRLPATTLVLTAVAVAAAAGLGYAGAALARAPRTRASPEALARRAAEAAEAEDYDEALRWTRLALARTPKSVRLLTDEAFFLEKTGDAEGALAAYARASEASTDGEPDYLAFLLAASLRLDDVAATNLCRALEKDPSLALGVRDAAAPDVLRRPDVQSVLRAAHRRLDERE